MAAKKKFPFSNGSDMSEYGIAQEPEEPRKQAVQGFEGPFVKRNKKADIILPSEEQMIAMLPETVQQITELWRRRTVWLRSQTSLTLQIKGFCRRLCPTGQKEEIHHVLLEDPTSDDNNKWDIKFKKPIKNPEADLLYAAIMTGKKDHPLRDKGMWATQPLRQAREMIAASIMSVEDRLQEASINLPGYQYSKDTRGISPATLYAIIGEAPGTNFRGLLDFRYHHNVFKRFGISCSEIDGKRQQKRSGADAIKEGYSPQRRSVLWNIGATIVKVGGPYRLTYDEIKESIRRKMNRMGITICPSAKIPKGREESFMSEGHLHNRSKRHMEKRLLLDYYIIWKKMEAKVGGFEWLSPLEMMSHEEIERELLSA